MTVKPAIYNDFVIYQGATFEEQLNFKNSQGENLDLGGYTARMKVKKSHADSDAILDLNTENNGITIDVALGNLKILVSAADTANLNRGVFVFDLELVNGDVVNRYMQGSMAVSAEVTA